MEHYDDDEEQRPPSKSALKREADAMKDLGGQLVELPAHQLATIELPERLAKAVNEARLITAWGGRKRQLQYIGKLMRSVDPEPIIASMGRFDAQTLRNKNELHEVEQWRERLLSEGDDALAELARKSDDVDIQQLRQLMRRAKSAKTEGQQVAAKRKLFQLIKSGLMVE